jgi:hypothetical protein
LGNGEPGRRRIESVVLAARTADEEFAARTEERARRATRPGDVWPWTEELRWRKSMGIGVENGAVFENDVKEQRKERDRKKGRGKKENRKNKLSILKKILRIIYIDYNIIR